MEAEQAMVFVGSRPVPLRAAMNELHSKFRDYIECAHAIGDEVSEEMLTLLDELCDRLSIKPDDLVEEIAQRDGLLKVRLDTGKTVLCFPNELQPSE
jgi:hypothetical protein